MCVHVSLRVYEDGANRDIFHGVLREGEKSSPAEQAPTLEMDSG